jgi:archaellum component FlaF (FlaF/FlaG flagellin family)
MNKKYIVPAAIIIAVLAIICSGTLFVAYKHSEEKFEYQTKLNDTIHSENVELKASLDKFKSSSSSETVDITLTEPIKLGNQVVMRRARIKTTKSANVTEQVKEALSSIQGLELSSHSSSEWGKGSKETTTRNGLLYFGLGAVSGAGAMFAVKKF